jgi:hypothetical protein
MHERLGNAEAVADLMAKIKASPLDAPSRTPCSTRRAACNPPLLAAA